MLENLPIYWKSFADDHSLLSELQKQKHYKTKGQPPYLSKIIHLALLLRYASLQAYKLLLEEFWIPSISLLAKLKFGNLDAIKAAELLRQKKILSNNVVLITDEMYLKKKYNILLGSMLVQIPMATCTKVLLFSCFNG